MEKKLVNIIVNAFLIIAFLLFIITILVKRFVYFKPSSQFIQTQDKYLDIKHRHLHGWFLENESSNKIILFCHGYMGNMSHEQTRIIALKNLGYSVLAFDYSGYGKSGGVPSEQQLYDDASDMIAFIRQKYRPEEIILYGFSLGGPVATYAARRYGITTLILESPLPSIKIYLKNKYPMLSFFMPLFSEFDTYAYLNGFKGKTLLLHSAEDEMISYESVKNLINISSLHIQMRGSHNNPIIQWNEVKRFIETPIRN
jgi:pimeloyl-ACP methyl ester carboxylesterase